MFAVMGRAAIGIVRVSQLRGRDPAVASPGEQRKRIEEACVRDNLELRDVVEELDVSGGTSLDRREGLRAAIEAVEAGTAQVVVVAYFDRLFRSLVVQAEVVSRIEKAGGEVLALDFGKVSEASAAQWLSGTMMGAFAEYYRRSAGERSRAAQVDAVKRGVVPFPSIAVGLERGKGGRLRPSSDAPTVVEAFELRAGGATIASIRKFLAGRGVALTYRGVQNLLGSRLLIGEIRFGDLVNAEAHEPVVSRDLWDRVQRAVVRRGGRPAKSERLLARLGVLRCGTCGSRLVVGSSNHGQFPTYRCSPTSDCPRRVAISATKVERVVVEAVKAALADVEGGASVEAHARESQRAAAVAQEKFDAAIRAFADFADEDVARETLSGLRDERDRTLEEAERLDIGAASVALTGADWDRLTLGERRDLIVATVDRVDVAPGRGDRISVKLFV